MDELLYWSLAAKQLLKEVTFCDQALDEGLLTNRQTRAILLLLSEHPRIVAELETTTDKHTATAVTEQL